MIRTRVGKYPVACYVLAHPKDRTRISAFYNSYFSTFEGQEEIQTVSLVTVNGVFSERFERVPNWRGNNGRDRRGHTACYWGHETMWRLALGDHDANFENGLIFFFEDDCRFDKDFWEYTKEALREIPDDFDILYLGGQHCINGRPYPKSFLERLLKIENVNRLHAYAVRISTLPKLILWFSENHDWGSNFVDKKTLQSEAEVDYAIGSLTENGTLNGFALKQWKTYQGASYSWTQGRQEGDRRW